MLTKSLHTITAATNVATFIMSMPHRRTWPEYKAADGAVYLANQALAVLGHSASPGDPTYDRIVANCAKVLA